jgi:cation diffusion facilitator CzcD-associated flavoprotein CzcO
VIGARGVQLVKWAHARGLVGHPHLAIRSPPAVLVQPNTRHDASWTQKLFGALGEQLGICAPAAGYGQFRPSRAKPCYTLRTAVRLVVTRERSPYRHPKRGSERKEGEREIVMQYTQCK